MYVHEGIARLQTLPRGINLIGDQLLDKFKNNYYVIDRLTILNWMSSVTKESLLAFI